MLTPTTSKVLVAFTTVACALAVAACGSSDPTTTNVSLAPASKRADALAFSQCMRSHGVPNFPDPGAGTGPGHGGGIQIAASARAGSGQSLSVNGVPVNAPAFRSAMTACRHDLPKAPAVPLAALRTAALAMARCMRAHGVPNFPDPQIGTGPGGVGTTVRIGGPGSGIDPSSPAFQAAVKICKPLFAKEGPAPGAP